MMKTTAIALLLCLVGLAPARGGAPQSYEDLLEMTDHGLRTDLLSPAQVKDLKARLIGEIDEFHRIANVGYLDVYPHTAELESKTYDSAGLSAMDQPYAIFPAVELAGRLNAAKYYANGAGPGMKGVLGDGATRESRNAYWDALTKIESHAWIKHAEALSNAYENALLKSKSAAPDTENLSLPELKAFYQDGAFASYQKAVETLIKRGEKEEIRASLRTPHPSRSHYLTAYALANLHPEEFTEDMAPLLKDQDPGVRYYAVYFLGNLNKKEYAAKVGELFSDSCSVVRGAAATFMRQVHAVEFKPQIQALLKDPDKDVRERAQTVLDGLK